MRSAIANLREVTPPLALTPKICDSFPKRQNRGPKLPSPAQMDLLATCPDGFGITHCYWNTVISQVNGAVGLSCRDRDQYSRIHLRKYEQLKFTAVHMRNAMPVNTFCDVTRLPLGRPDFSDIRKNGKVYVDKTALLAQIARYDVPIFLSRPRRFGKSLLVNTFASLFSKGLEDFHGLNIEQKWHEITYPVVHFDFSDMADFNSDDLRRALCNDIIDQFDRQENIFYSDEKYRFPGEILKKILKNISNRSIVMLIDEYDAPLTHNINNQTELNNIMCIINNFYAVIKEYTSKFRFIFITGVTRTSHISIFSAFNNLRDISIEKEFNTLLGFTKKEIHIFFDQYIKNAAQVLGMSKESIYTRLEQYYDGFQFATETCETLYNPWSVLSFLQNPGNGFQNYWYQSGGMSSLYYTFVK